MQKIIKALKRKGTIKLAAQVRATMENDAKEDYKMLYEELQDADPKKEFLVKKRPNEPDTRLEKIEKAQKKWIRDKIGVIAVDKVYHDRKPNYNTYSVLTTDNAKDLVRVAKAIESELPVKVYLMPYVSLYSNRPLSYFKISVAYME